MIVGSLSVSVPANEWRIAVIEAGVIRIEQECTNFVREARSPAGDCASAGNSRPANREKTSGGAVKTAVAYRQKYGKH